ncbi:MAG TPA: HK97-gp10 family putative phage morphogenesis protein [Candidatus Angelobacter sp.]|nr:HK97-gp10 family putative phage morphogenesis protein [Candidatus Angelobacter sp.]
MANNVKVVGLTELGAALDLLPRKIEQEYIRTAVKKGAEVIRADAEARAPKLSGDMASKITVKTLTSRFKGTFTAIIGVRFMRLLASFGRHGHAPSSEDPGIYSRFVEEGRPGKGGHTHQEAHPFIGPAFDAKTAEAEQVVADELKRQLGGLVS